MSKKAVVDAVNDLRGEFESLSNYQSVSDNAIKMILFNSFKNKYYGASLFLGSEGWSKVCTIEEFNQCIAEMSEGLFVPDCRKQPEIQYDKDGNGWEVGSVYEFSDDRIEWLSGTFSGYSPNNKRKYVDDTKSHWEYIRECQSPIGKVHIKPVELIDGAAYQFESCSSGKLWVGFYNSADFAFYESIGGETDPVMIGSVKDFKNIIRLVPEVK